MHFADPEFLLLLPMALAYLVLRWPRASRPPRVHVGFPGLAFFAGPAAGGRTRWLALPVALRTLALALIALALARPQEARGTREILSQGLNILVTLDVSGSMRAEDFRPRNRLHVAKRVVADFIGRRSADRIGLVVFAGKAFTLVPLTTERAVLLEMLERVRIGMLPDGTAIGSALATSLNHVKDVPARSSVVILLTDGVNNTGRLDPVTAAEAARALGVRVYTIGVGTHGTAPFLVEDPLVGRRYVELPVTIDEDVLGRIASRTGGRYFRAQDPRALAAILGEIDRLETTEIRVRDRTSYSELFGAFLNPALALLGLELLLRLTVLRMLP
ncbi:MAG: VWA domain-containing protein [Gemmatimonadetes bacterium]|nr:VWA domain-containing protein [Gemmatimonadota bacterium]